jgi:hypothetical protein
LNQSGSAALGLLDDVVKLVLPVVRVDEQRPAFAISKRRPYDLAEYSR